MAETRSTSDSTYVISGKTLVDIADIIRSVKGTPDTIPMLQMKDIINTIVDSFCKEIAGSIETLEIPAGTPAIREYAFYKLLNLKSITIPGSVSSVGSNAFTQCKALTAAYVDLPKWCEATRSAASSSPFVANENVVLYVNGEPASELIIPDSVENINSYAFHNCNSITSLKISDSVLTIGVQAFYECAYMTDVEIGNGVSNIAKSAFNSCSRLESIKFGSALTNIADRAFYRCFSCLRFDFSDCADVPTLETTNAFYEMKSTAKIIVPTNLYSRWVTSTNWTDLASNITSVYKTGLDPSTGEQLVPIDDIWILPHGQTVWDVEGPLKAYYSINGGDKVEITSTDNLFGAGDIYFSYSYTEESMEHYYTFYGSYCYVWNSGTHEIWVEDSTGRKIYHRTVEVT